MSVAIIDYGSGNLHSAAKAFERAARSLETPQKVFVTSDPDQAYSADRLVLPGVGAFADCRRGLDAVNGMVEAITEAVRVKARPFFGICVGMQLMASRGKEHVTTDGLNWIGGDVEKITPRDESLKIPHMGWNTLDMLREHPVLNKLPLGPGASTLISCTPTTSTLPTRRTCSRVPTTAGPSPRSSRRTPPSAPNSTPRRASVSAWP